MCLFRDCSSAQKKEKNRAIFSTDYDECYIDHDYLDRVYYNIVYPNIGIRYV
jgi:hypothetical protein